MCSSDLSPSAINAMGSKIKARDLAKELGVPVVPGTEGGVTDIKEALAFAKEAGYPVMIKASAGGGGRGLRVVRTDAELRENMEVASREALAAFGDGAVFIEKYVERPHHIEFQILADKHGNIIHLGERDCSIQRRHQKLIEILICFVPPVELDATAQHHSGRRQFRGLLIRRKQHMERRYILRHFKGCANQGATIISGFRQNSGAANRRKWHCRQQFGVVLDSVPVVGVGPGPIEHVLAP